MYTLASDHQHHQPGQGDGAEVLVLAPGEWVVLVLLVLVAGTYVAAVVRLRRRGTAWPVARAASWVAGGVAVGGAVVGPLAQRAHHDVTAHMAGHLLLGMLAPLLLVLAAPVTLALRTLPVRAARPLARALASGPVSVLTHPWVAGLLNVGGLWLLYRTGLYAATHDAPVLHVLVHVHVLAAGYLFGFAVLGGPDPAPHRLSARWRAAALVIAVAAHNILAKSIYAAPPAGVPTDQARAGAELMYYGGMPVEIALMVLVCTPWLLPRRRGTARVGRLTNRTATGPANG